MKILWWAFVTTIVLSCQIAYSSGYSSQRLLRSRGGGTPEGIPTTLEDYPSERIGGYPSGPNPSSGYRRRSLSPAGTDGGRGPGGLSVNTMTFGGPGTTGRRNFQTEAEMQNLIDQVTKIREKFATQRPGDNQRTIFKTRDGGYAYGVKNTDRTREGGRRVGKPGIEGGRDGDHERVYDSVPGGYGGGVPGRPGSYGGRGGDKRGRGGDKGGRGGDRGSGRYGGGTTADDFRRQREEMQRKAKEEVENYQAKLDKMTPEQLRELNVGKEIQGAQQRLQSGGTRNTRRGGSNRGGGPE